MASVLIVGGGVFGASTALALLARGWSVTAIDPGPLPHPDASSTDISKIVRADYGADDALASLVATALPLWDAWSPRMPRPLWHPTGFQLMTTLGMTPGGFEHDSLQGVRRLGLPATRVHRLQSPWHPDLRATGYVSERAGWAESGAVVAWMWAEARRGGARVVPARAIEVAPGQVRTADATLVADEVIVAAGAWTPHLVPELRSGVRAVGQPVLHFAPSDPAPFRSPNFRPWSLDIATTGFYGFPATDDGRVKLGHHGRGRPVDPRAERVFPAGFEAHARAFLARSLPALADAPIVHRRVCMYADSVDGDFWIDRVPGRDRLLVATGGSGHGFKFAPVLGGLVADVLEDRATPWRHRFGWRTPPRRREHARSDADP